MFVYQEALYPTISSSVLTIKLFYPGVKEQMAFSSVDNHNLIQLDRADGVCHIMSVITSQSAVKRDE